MAHPRWLGALLLCSVCLALVLAPRAGSAAGRNASHLVRLAAHRLLSPGKPMGAGRVLRPRDTVLQSRPHLTPSGLRVPDSYFAPGVINASFDYVEDNPTADQNAFASDHTTIYENLSRITGYYERADWNSPGGVVIFRYQGSIMSDDAHALTAQQDNISYQQSALGGQVSPCPNANPPPQSFPNCSYVATQDAQRTFWFADYAWAVGFCLVETEAQFPQTMPSATVTQVETTLSNFTFQARQQASQLCASQGGPAPTATRTVPAPPAASTATVPPAAATTTRTPTPVLAVDTPTQTPLAGPAPGATKTATPTTRPSATATTAPPSVPAVSILSVRVEKKGAKPDISKPPLTIVKAGQTVLLAIYVEVLDNASKGIPISFRFTEKRAGKQVMSKSVQDSVPATLPAQLRDTVSVKPTKQGKYILAANVSYQGQSQKRSTTFTVAGSTTTQCVTIGGAPYCP